MFNFNNMIPSKEDVIGALSSMADMDKVNALVAQANAQPQAATPQAEAATGEVMQVQKNPMDQFVDAAKAGKFDPTPIIEELVKSQGERKEPTSFLDRMSDGERMLLEAGLATMAAGGQPGATLGGSLGKGGMAALKGADTRKKDKQERSDKRAKNRVDELLAMSNLAKAGYDVSQDAVMNNIRQRQLDYEGRRVDLAESQFNDPGFELKQTADGSFVQIPKRGDEGARFVKGPDGSPLMGAPRNPFHNQLYGAIGDYVANSAGIDSAEEIDKNIGEIISTFDRLSGNNKKNYNVPPQGAVELLLKRPDTAADFERKYGVPAALFLQQQR